LANTVRPDVTMSVKDALGSEQLGGGGAPDPGTYPRTAAVAELVTSTSPPKNPLMIGVRKVNGTRTVTVTVLPAPAPPVADAQGIVEPIASAQLVVTTGVPSPAWPWAFFSAATRAVIPTMSVGAPDP
jgi:hypothetical protein